MAKESPRRLLEACGRGDAAQVRELLESSRIDVNASERGWTPAYVASQNGKTEVLQALIEAGCDVNASREDGAVPATIAAEKGHAETLHALIAAGCDVRSSRVRRRTKEGQGHARDDRAPERPQRRRQHPPLLQEGGPLQGPPPRQGALLPRLRQGRLGPPPPD